jgi:hypothetical protein
MGSKKSGSSIKSSASQYEYSWNAAVKFLSLREEGTGGGYVPELIQLLSHR